MKRLNAASGGHPFPDRFFCLRWVLRGDDPNFERPPLAHRWFSRNANEDCASHARLSSAVSIFGAPITLLRSLGSYRGGRCGVPLGPMPVVVPAAAIEKHARGDVEALARG